MSSAAWGARCTRRTGELEAIEPLVEAVRLAPRAVHLHQLLGISLAKAKRFDEAEAAFRRALALDPTDAGSYNGLGVVQAEAKRFDEAEASCREAIRLNPRSRRGPPEPW